MPARSTTIFDELAAAVRGCWALLTGDRKAPEWFDFSRRGLAGSLIALLAITALEGLVPILLSSGPAHLHGLIARSVLINCILYALQIGATGIVLRQFDRPDGLQPYLVCFFWAAATISAVGLILAVIGVDPMILLIGTSVLALVLQINICRLIVTLKPNQIVILFIAQLAAGFVSLIVIGLIFPTDPAVMDQVLSQAGLQS